MSICKKDITDKEFTVDYKGYDSKEVDLFLDLVATNYEILEFVNKLKNKIRFWKIIITSYLKKLILQKHKF